MWRHEQLNFRQERMQGAHKIPDHCLGTRKHCTKHCTKHCRTEITTYCLENPHAQANVHGVLHSSEQIGKQVWDSNRVGSMLLHTCHMPDLLHSSQQRVPRRRGA